MRSFPIDARAVFCILLLATACGPKGVSTVPVATPPPALSPILATPSSLAFTALGPAYTETVTLSEPNYSGGFSLETACTIVSPVVVTVTSYAITPLANGTCTLTFFDANGQSINVPVTVNAGATPQPTPSMSPSPSPSTMPTTSPSSTPTNSPTIAPSASPTSSPGLSPIVAHPVSFAFLGAGSALAQTLTLTEVGYSGSFSLKAACAQTTVTQTTAATFTIAPAAAGSCGLSFGDTNGQTILVPVVVTVTNGGGQ